MRYYLPAVFTIPAPANPRFADLSSSELKRAERAGREAERIIGGDLGDLAFSGFTVDGDVTTLQSPALLTNLEGLTADQAHDIAAEVLGAAYASVGVECVY